MSLSHEELSETLIELAEIPGYPSGEYAFCYDESAQEPGQPKRIDVLAPNGAGEWQVQPMTRLLVTDIHGTPYWDRKPRRRTLERRIREWLEVNQEIADSQERRERGEPEPEREGLFEIRISFYATEETAGGFERYAKTMLGTHDRTGIRSLEFTLDERDDPLTR